MKTYLTHSGLFHADEVAGYVIARKAGIVANFLRTDKDTAQNMAAIDQGETLLVADILGVYDPAKFRFDHHQQRPGQTPELYRGNGIPYATAGLLWKHFGFRVCGEDLLVKSRVETLIFEQLDANDAAPDWYAEGYAAGNPVRVMTLSNLISAFNADNIRDDDKQAEAFEAAANWFETVLDKAIKDAKSYATNYRKFSEITTYDVETRTILTEGFIQGGMEIAAEMYPNALYMFGKSSFPAPNYPYSLTALPIRPGRRELKKPIKRPVGWPEKQFIHGGKFIAAVKDWENAKILILMQ
jgi:uncharacterized UPF0160 family protein